VVGCDRRIVSHELCTLHWDRVRKHGTTDPYRGRGGAPRYCSVEQCERQIANAERMLCNLHYKRFLRRGHTEFVPRTRTPYVDPNGYVRERVEGERQGILQHRLVMERHLGRRLWPDETVHHKNGVRSDNRLQNLELWSSWQPRGQRVGDKLAWAKEIIARYG
jgi:hypothetical protein